MLKKIIISSNCFEFLMVVASRKNQELYLIYFSNLFLSYRQYTRVVFAIIKQVLLKYNRVLYLNQCITLHQFHVKILGLRFSILSGFFCPVLIFVNRVAKR